MYIQKNDCILFLLACVLIQFVPLNANCKSVHESKSNAIRTIKSKSDFIQVAPKPLDYFEREQSLLQQTPNPLKGTLKIPRLAVDEETQQRLSLQMQYDAKVALACAMTFASSGDERFRQKTNQYLAAWSHIDKFSDGGRFFWDFFIFRMAGDTPIVLFCQFSKFVVAAELVKNPPIEFHEQVQRAYDYAREYRPAQNNNHQSWQNLFLVLCSLFCHDNEHEKYFEKLDRCMTEQIDTQGRMPLELGRGRKALTYTLMNLEALIYSAYIARVYGYQMNEKNLQKALDFFLLYFVDEIKWRALSGIRQEINHPDSIETWQWIMVLPHRWWGKSAYDSLATNAWNIDAKRSYLLFYPQLLSGDLE